MRLLAAILISVGGYFAAQVTPLAYLVAIGICVVAFVSLVWASVTHARIASLRHAALAAGGGMIVAVIFGLLLFSEAEITPGARDQLRSIALVAATIPALYWLILLWTDGFRERM